MRIEQQLNDITDRLARLRREMEIASEQLTFQKEVVDDSKTRMLVSETPLADREYREARDDLRRLEKYYEECRLELDELTKIQDRLLDRLLARAARR
ncbi:MAG: hypothetical protein ACRD1T_23755 [Acidimicrobiia bacterium]